MSSRRAVLHLREMQDMALWASRFCDGMSREQFLADQKTRQACLFNLLIIGECSARILQDHRLFADRFPHMPWPNMKGMRNHIAHGFSTLNFDTIWATLEQAVPALITMLPDVIEAAAEDHRGA
ncbi:uncharacterized protein with HEPN domain [Rhizobium sp. PP-CC-3G-465]|nr:uncharacterized protein with HEPN domain [Rhizobium sp. PP-CC-3A-592]TCQ29038.1 uncharacterized protein with HEPN domain [Rhizobium sp. PP-CC-3G-465]